MSPKRKGRKVAHKLALNRQRRIVSQFTLRIMRKAVAESVTKWIASPQFAKLLDSFAKMGEAFTQLSVPTSARTNEDSFLSVLNPRLPQPAPLPSAWSEAR